MKYVATFICLTATISIVTCAIDGSKEWVTQTKGSVWPKPQQQELSDEFFTISSKNFHFLPKPKCSIISEAFGRYKRLLIATTKVNTEGHKLASKHRKKKKKAGTTAFGAKYLGEFSDLQVVLNGVCNDSVYPSLEMQEHYTINITSTGSTLVADTVWGILRGLESFSQLTYITGDDGTLFINKTYIQDYPRFKHRGLLLDTSRHFIPKNDLLRTLDAMAYNKFNVFHWHMTDLQSFPFKSITFPELSEKGAWHPIYAVYDRTDVKEIIEYARKRGIRVIPEFDTPGHTASWGDSHKELLTTCYDGLSPNDVYGPLDVSKNFTYNFVEQLLREVSQLFPDQYMHIGGDEVNFDCWESNPDINDFMGKMNITGDYAALEDYYIKQVVNMVSNFSKSPLVWEEVFTNGVQLPNSTLVQIWKTDNPKSVLSAATKAGKQVIFSACYYLDVSWEWFQWSKFYQCDPTNFEGTDEQKKLVLGGEVALWAEFVSEYNLDSKLWPRASAGAERLWSNVPTPEGVVEFMSPAARLEEHICRLNKRNIHAEPASGPNYCL